MIESYLKAMRPANSQTLLAQRFDNATSHCSRDHRIWYFLGLLANSALRGGQNGPR
jgi:hypothetical protein